MIGWPTAPVIYEIDTRPWLTAIGERVGQAVTLADVPAAVWDEVARAGLDAVWLMGVWERSPAGLAVARHDSRLQAAFHHALPDLRPEDVSGSPYSVRRYEADGRLGGRTGLAVARSELARRGLKLILDYVPNHVAPDHPAIHQYPSWFIHGTDADLERDPGGWFRAGGHVLARGRDPYLPPWPDVAQLNAFDPGLRAAAAETMIAIADQCDGMRVDMAMLVTNEVFARTWGDRAGPAPGSEFWPEAIDRLRKEHPQVVLIAEAYWDTEFALQQQGFDFCYDKRLYDRLARETAATVRVHLSGDREFQRRLLRFTENHDEQRAATAMPGGRDRAAAVAVATLPGATLWHDGQFEGRRVHLPVFLTRAPEERADEDKAAFYHRLVEIAGGLRRGEWRLLEAHGWPDNDTHESVLAWAWHDGRPHHLIVVNLSGKPAQARIPLPWDELRGRGWRLVDLLDGRAFERGGEDLSSPGLYVDLPAWGVHILAVATAQRA
jgi:hypothetical protein